MKIYKNHDEQNIIRWYFYGLNTKVKKIKTQRRSKKAKLFSFLFFVVNIIVVGCVLAKQIHSEAGVDSIKNVFTSQHNTKFFILAIVCFLLAELLVAFKLNCLTKKYDKKGNFNACLKSEFVCQYYSKITPFGLGGQPFQVYVLNKHGIKANNAITVVSCNYVSHKLMYWLVTLVMMMTVGCNYLVKELSGASFNVVLVLATISITIMTIYLTFVILVFMNKKVASNLIATILRFLSKIRIIKNRKLLYFKIMRPALSFQHKMKKFFTSKKLTTFTMLLSLIIYLIYACIPACIYFIFNPFSWIYMWRLVSIGVIITLSFGVNPIPGGSGVAELSFYTVFTILIDKGLVFWALIIWRVLTYYIYLLIGVIILIYDYVYGNKKSKRRLEKIRLDNQLKLKQEKQ